jgi:hypothetical protein
MVQNPNTVYCIDRLKAKGADFIKVYDGLSRESYFEIATEANRIHIPFAGHVPQQITIEEAIDAGQKSIEHGIEGRGTTTEEQHLIDMGRSENGSISTRCRRACPTICTWAWSGGPGKRHRWPVPSSVH